MVSISLALIFWIADIPYPGACVAGGGVAPEPPGTQRRLLEGLAWPRRAGRWRSGSPAIARVVVIHRLHFRHRRRPYGMADARLRPTSV